MSFYRCQISAFLLVLAWGTLCLAQPQPPAEVVVDQVIQQTAATNSTAIGMVYFERVSRLSTEIAGLVKTVHFREGDQVARGDLLIELDTDFIDRDIAIARAQLEQIAVQIARNAKDLQRYEKLVRNEAASEKEYDDLEFMRRDLQQQKIYQEQELDKALLRRTKSTIRAPYAGLVLDKLVDAGDWLSLGDELCRLGSLADCRVRVPVAEELVRFAPAGTASEVIINAFQQSVNGTIVGVQPVADEQTKNIFLKITIPYSPGLVENMSATVRIPTSKPMELLMIPRDALVSFQGQQFVYTVADDAASLVPIRVVGFFGSLAGVQSPVARPGMPVVVDGNERLRPGQPVRVITPTTANSHSSSANR